MLLMTELCSLLLLAAATVQASHSDVSRSIALLDDDDPDVRDRASGALERLGGRAWPALEAARLSGSSEARSRIDDLLERMPEFVEAAVMRHRRFPLLKKYWDGIFEALREKRPIPGALWLDLMDRDEVDPPDSWDMADWEHRGSHSPGWLGRVLIEEGRWALASLSSLVGIEALDLEAEVPPTADYPLPEDLFHRLVRLRPDAATFEEVYLTVLILHSRGLLGRFRFFSSRDWDVVLGVLVTLRRRAGEASVELPKSTEEAIQGIARGLWMKGLSHALGRAMATPGYLSKERMIGSRRALGVLTRGRKGDEPLERVYAGLVDLEMRIGRRYFQPERLKSARLRLPTPEQCLPDCASECFRGLAKGIWPDEESFRIGRALASCGHGESDPERGTIEDDLVRALSIRIVSGIRAAGP